MKIYSGNETIKGKNILLYFYANFMPGHKRMMNIINNIKEDMFEIVVIDVGEFKDLAVGYDIKYVPTFLFIKNKKVHSKIEGLQMSSVINSAVYNVFHKGKKTK